MRPPSCIIFDSRQSKTLLEVLWTQRTIRSPFSLNYDIRVLEVLSISSTNYAYNHLAPNVQLHRHCIAEEDASFPRPSHKEFPIALVADDTLTHSGTRDTNSAHWHAHGQLRKVETSDHPYKPRRRSASNREIVASCTTIHKEPTCHAS